jgi:hypothetical protein
MRCDKTRNILAVRDALLYCLDMVSISIHSACGGTLDVLAAVLGCGCSGLPKGSRYSGLQKVIA